MECEKGFFAKYKKEVADNISGAALNASRAETANGEAQAAKNAAAQSANESSGFSDASNTALEDAKNAAVYAKLEADEAENSKIASALIKDAMNMEAEQHKTEMRDIEGNVDELVVSAAVSAAEMDNRMDEAKAVTGMNWVSSTVNSNGELILNYSDSSNISAASIDADGHLQITYI